MKITAAWANFTIVLLLIALYWLSPSLINTIENKTYDLRLVSQGVEEPSGDVVIAAIDEKSLEAHGRWPWSRQILAQLLNELSRADAKVVVLDIFFPERENEDLLRRIDRRIDKEEDPASILVYQEMAEELSSDRRLLHSISLLDNTVLSMAFIPKSEAEDLDSDTNKQRFESVKDNAIDHLKLVGDASADVPMPKQYGLLVNLPEFERMSPATGHIVYPPDIDGTVRRAPFVHKYNDLYFPSADIQAVKLFENDKLALRINSYGIAALELGNKMIPTDEFGRALINFYGPERTFTTLSVTDILNKNYDQSSLKGKIVIIGATAAGINDLRVTPYHASFPGVEMRANVIQNLLDDNFLQRPGWMTVVDILTLLLIGALLSWWLPKQTFWVSSTTGFVVALVYVAIGIYLFDAQGLWLNLTYPIILILTLFVSTTVIKYFTTEREKRDIKGAFKQYVPETVVDNVVMHMDSLKLGGDKRTLSVLFSDIRSFTTKSESLEAETLVPLLNEYLDSMTDVVFHHNGTLDKYIGDAIMAIYGAPVYYDNHAVLACKTAVNMMEKLVLLQSNWKDAGLDGIDIGIGINTGPMIVGNMGSQRRFDYTVIGDSVNLGARLESLNKEYGTHILISEFTCEQVKKEFTYLREVDQRTVKGKTRKVGIFEIMLPLHYPQLNAAFLKAYNEAYRLMRSEQKEEAKALFQEIYEQYGDPVSMRHIRYMSDRRRL